MLIVVIKNKLSTVTVQKHKAECLSLEDGNLLGQSLALSLATTLTASAEVDEWILQFLALQQIDSEYIWFRPIMDAVGLVLEGQVGRVVKMRVSLER